MAFYADHKLFVFESLNFSKAFIFPEFDFININRRGYSKKISD